MIVVLDTFDNDPFPVFINDIEVARIEAKRYDSEPMSRVIEVYVLDPERRDDQIALDHAYNFELS